jgi:hypothetical protein
MRQIEFGDVISSPSKMLRTGCARNLRSLTFVRDDNLTTGDLDTVLKEENP